MCMRTSTGVSCVGLNSNGQLGVGSTTNANRMPITNVANIGTTIDISCGYAHTCVVLTAEQPFSKCHTYDHKDDHVLANIDGVFKFFIVTVGFSKLVNKHFRNCICERHHVVLPFLWHL